MKSLKSQSTSVNLSLDPDIQVVAGRSFMGCCELFLIMLSLTSGAVFGQSKLVQPTTVLGVCEALHDREQYDGNAIVLVGRLETSASPTDHHAYLSEDGCERESVEVGHAVGNKILLLAFSEGMPIPPEEHWIPKVTILAAKMRSIRRSTVLGTHQEPAFQTKDGVIQFDRMITRPNEWAAAYGRLVMPPDASSDCDSEGCGGTRPSMILIVKPYNAITLTSQGRPKAQLP